jgi:hypothetical protein
VHPSSNLKLSRELTSNLDIDDDYFSDILFFEGLRALSRSMAFDVCSKFFISDVSFGRRKALRAGVAPGTSAERRQSSQQRSRRADHITFPGAVLSCSLS